MKGIIIVDIPDDCRLCPTYDSEVNYCSCVDKKILEVKKPDWCPIKPMPKKKSMDLGQTVVNAARNEGWNECIDEILGEK